METVELKPASFTVSVPKIIENNCKVNDSKVNVKVTRSPDPSPLTKSEPAEVAYEGEDEHEENSSVKRNIFDFDLPFHEGFSSSERRMALDEPDLNEMKSSEIDLIQSGHVSDPGFGKAEIWASPMLKRSCSNLETRQVLRKIADHLPPSKSQSFEELQGLAPMEDMNHGSPASVLSHFSADKVMLKKHSSSQILPSRSRRLWWKLFLWSHRNLHQQRRIKPVNSPLAVMNQQGGYSSDTIEPSRSFKFKMTESSLSRSSAAAALKGKMVIDNVGLRSGSGLWPHNQWVAFAAESSSSNSPLISRVDEWVNDLSFSPESPYGDDHGVNSDEGGVITFPPSPKTARSPSNKSNWARHFDPKLPEEVLHANSIVQSLNSSSTVAHICGIGLKVMPSISHFSSLKSVNLSSNSIGTFLLKKTW